MSNTVHQKLVHIHRLVLNGNCLDNPSNKLAVQFSNNDYTNMEITILVKYVHSELETSPCLL